MLRRSKRIVCTILVTCFFLVCFIKHKSNNKIFPITAIHEGDTSKMTDNQNQHTYGGKLNTIQSINQKLKKQRNVDSRKRLFIIAQGRTGSSLFGDLIDSHGEFIYYFEPLRAVERHLNISYFHLKPNDPLYSKYHRTVARFLDNLMSCRLTKEDDAILILHDKGHFRHRSRILTRDPFCSKRTGKGGGITCKPLTSQLMNQYCLDNPNTNIVIKELEFRIPEASILRLVETSHSLHHDSNVQVIHLVRDPRSFLLSMKRLGWMETPGSDPEHLFIKKRCLEIQNNVIRMSLFYQQQKQNHHRSIYQTTITTKTSFFKNRYRIFKYEDFARENAETSLGRALSVFLGLDFVNTTRVFYSAKFTKSSISHGDPFSTGRRNIITSLQRWRRKKHKEYVKKIEMTCKDLMILLDYEPVP